MDFVYPANVEQDEAGYFLVTFPDLQGVATDGETLEEALEEAIDALEEGIAGYINRGEDIPVPSEASRDQYSVALPTQMALKAILVTNMTTSGMTNRALAKALGINEREVRRMRDPHHGTKLPRLEEALQVFGKRLVITEAPALPELQRHVA